MTDIRSKRKYPQSFMNSHSFIGQWLSVVCILLISCIILTSVFTHTASADELIKRQLVEKVGFLDSAAFNKYEEIKILHEQTLITVQALPASDITSSTNIWVNLVVSDKGIIRGFDELTDLTSGNGPESHKKALEKGKQIQTTVRSLESYPQAQENFIPIVAQLALKHFFSDEGQFFEELAESENNTEKRIEYLDNSYIAYDLAGDLTKTSYLDLKIKETKSEYNYDMDIINKNLESGNESLITLNESIGEGNNTGFIPSVKGILAAKSAKESYSVVYDLYLKHDDEKSGLINITISDINNSANDLEQTFIRYVLGFIVLFSTIIIYGLYSLYTWKLEVDDTLLGEEVIR